MRYMRIALLSAAATGRATLRSQFLRGIYAMNPLTPPGLPYGDRAVLAQFDDFGSGIVFFIDGDKACTPMTAPPELLSLMKDVATRAIRHEQAEF